MERATEKGVFRRLRASFGDASSRALIAGTAMLLVLLAVLATLEYRWLGRVGEAEAEQLRAGARDRSEQLARDFDRNIARAFLWLGADAATATVPGSTRYSERWRRWVSGAPNPRLVKEVFLVTPGSVSRFDPGLGRFEATTCPTELQSICDRAQKALDPVAEKTRRSRYPTDPLDDEVPAIIAPVLSNEGEPPPEDHPPDQRLLGFTVMLLDGALIRERILPELAQRHFGSPSETDFGIKVMRRAGDEKVLFHYGPHASCRFAKGDVGTGLFELRFEELGSSDFSGFVFPGGKPYQGPRPARSDSGRWRLAATHRAGSVDAVVAAAKRRNLAIVGCILLLLAASAVLVLRSAQRARHMAGRQLEFVATVSHELRTPLAVICSAGENLADGIVRDEATVKEYGAVVRDEGRRLAGMVERVLDFAGSYSGKRMLHLERLELHSFLDECEGAVEPIIAEAGVRLETRYADALPAVRADRRALRRVVVNLVENAAKHGRDGGFVRLEAEVVAGPRGRRVVQVRVVDRGAGIPADERTAIFEPFFRGREAVRRQLPGSGLGLSLVDRIVRAHGGRVEIRSVPGGETVFTLELPALEEESA